MIAILIFIGFIYSWNLFSKKNTKTIENPICYLCHKNSGTYFTGCDKSHTERICEECCCQWYQNGKSFIGCPVCNQWVKNCPVCCKQIPIILEDTFDNWLTHTIAHLDFKRTSEEHFQRIIESQFLICPENIHRPEIWKKIFNTTNHKWEIFYRYLIFNKKISQETLKLVLQYPIVNTEYTYQIFNWLCKNKKATANQLILFIRWNLIKTFFFSESQINRVFEQCNEVLKIFPSSESEIAQILQDYPEIIPWIKNDFSNKKYISLLYLRSKPINKLRKYF